MVQNLTAQQLTDLDSEALLEKAIRDDRVLRLLEDVIRIKRAHLSTWLDAKANEDVATLDPQAPANDVIEVLAYEGFTPNWLLSYEYAGEVANLVRFHYDPHLHPEYPFRQLHVRVFADGTLEAHEEASALMHKGPHIREESVDSVAGSVAVETIFEDAGIEYSTLQ